MSELISKQEVLSEIAFAMVDDIPDVQALYDKIESMEPAQQTLNSNQQIVLEWLKDEMNASSVTNALWLLLDDALEVDYDTDASGMWNRLPKDQQYQVLAAFAEWGCKSNE